MLTRYLIRFQAEEAYTTYHDKLFVPNTGGATELLSSMNNEQYLDAISAPRIDPGGRTRTKPLTKKPKVTGDTIDISNDADEDESDDAGVQEDPV